MMIAISLMISNLGKRFGRFLGYLINDSSDYIVDDLGNKIKGDL